MISVCIATFNGEKYVMDQILSILIQLNVDDELIISDDSSSDHTVEVIKGITDPRIRLFTDNEFRDPIKNFQNALTKAKGEVIFLADQDDVWIEGKYQNMVGLLDEYDLVISDSIIVDEELNTLNPSFFKYFGSGKGILKNMIKSSYYGSCMAFRKRILNAALPFPNTKEIGHDLWIGLVAEMLGNVYFYPKPLLLYRRHTNAFTPVTVGKSTRTMFQMLIGRIIMVKEVTRFYLKNKFKCRKV